MTVEWSTGFALGMILMYLIDHFAIADAARAKATAARRHRGR